jgi:hypothetical protein
MADKIEKELAWDAEIDQDGGDFTLLPAGEYPFRVVKLEKARFGGKAGGLPPCNQVKLTLDVGDAENSTTINTNLFLHTRTAGFLGAFFRSIGARKHGEKMIMDWSKVQGATGRCKVSIREWTGKDKEKHETNEIKAFLDPVAAPADGQGDLAF